MNNKVYDTSCCQITIYRVVTELIMVLIDLVAKLQIQVKFTMLPSVELFLNNNSLNSFKFTQFIMMLSFINTIINQLFLCQNFNINCAL